MQRVEAAGDSGLADHDVTEKTPVSPKHAPVEVTEYVPDIVPPRIVPVKLPISGEVQLTAIPETAHCTIVALEKQGESCMVMLPEKIPFASVTIKVTVPDETALLLAQMPFQI